jgi:hypothetical protein
VLFKRFNFMRSATRYWSMLLDKLLQHNIPCAPNLAHRWSVTLGLKHASEAYEHNQLASLLPTARTTDSIVNKLQISNKFNNVYVNKRVDMCLIDYNSHNRPWTYWLQRSAAELSSPGHCIRYTNLLIVLVQIANKMGLKQKKLIRKLILEKETR